MPSVVFSHMHHRDFDAFCAMFNAIGWKVYIPSNKEPNYFGYGITAVPTKGEYTVITYAECLDIKPDVVLCLCWEQLHSSMAIAKQAGSKFVVRAGNNSIPYNHTHSNFLISNDTHTFNRCDIPNKLLFYLPPDYDFYTKQNWYEDSYIVPSYIHFYEKYWKTSWNIYSQIRTDNRDIAFVNFGHSDDGFKYPILNNAGDVKRTLGISRCLLHVKEAEGYGWSLLEAISCGIPVVAFKPFVTGKTCEHFLIDGKTVRFITNSASEFRKIFDDVESLRAISEIGSKFIREFINAEEQYNNVKRFFEEIVLA